MGGNSYVRERISLVVILRNWGHVSTIDNRQLRINVPKAISDTKAKYEFSLR